MKKLLFFLLMFSLSALASNTVVTATITGQDGLVWSNGTYKVEFRPAPNNPTPASKYTSGGISFTQLFSGTLDSTGTFSVTLTDTNTISPALSQWTFTICPNASFQCYSTNQSITGGSVNLSTTLSALTPTIIINAPPLPKAYSSSEVNTPPSYGAQYYNTTLNQLFIWNGVSWTGPAYTLLTAIPDNSTDNSAAMQAAFNSAATSCGTVFLPAATTPYKITNQVIKPHCVSFKGAGGYGNATGSVINISGNGLIGFLGDSTSTGNYENEGTWSDLEFLCTNNAATAIKIVHRERVSLEHISVNYLGQGTCTSSAVILNNDLITDISHSFFSNSGNASDAQVDVDTGTTFKWDHSYISDGANTIVGGLAVNRNLSETIIDGGAIESTGIPILIANKTESSTVMQSVKIQNIDLENARGGSYIQVGKGWGGSASNAVHTIQIQNVQGNTSGSVDTQFGVDLYNTFKASLGPNNIFTGNNLANSAVYNLNGTGNANTILYGSVDYSGSFTNVVNINGAAVNGITGPITFWTMGGAICNGNTNNNPICWTSDNASNLRFSSGNGGTSGAPLPVNLIPTYWFVSGSNFQGYGLTQDVNGAHLSPSYAGTGSAEVLSLGDPNNGVTTDIYGSQIRVRGNSLQYPLITTTTNCSSSASPAVCSASPTGSVSLAAAATTLVVNTTAVTANSQILINRDNSLGSRLSVTCNTQSSLVLGTPYVSARSAGTSFTVTIDVAPTTNPLCLSYSIIN